MSALLSLPRPDNRQPAAENAQYEHTSNYLHASTAKRDARFQALTNPVAQSAHSSTEPGSPHMGISSPPGSSFSDSSLPPTPVLGSSRLEARPNGEESFSTLTTPSHSPRAASPMILLAAADVIQRMDDAVHPKERGMCHWGARDDGSSDQWDAEEQRTFEAVCSLLTHGFRR